MQVNRDVYFAVREVSSRHLRFTNLHHAWLKLCRVERQMTEEGIIFSIYSCLHLLFLHVLSFSFRIRLDDVFRYEENYSSCLDPLKNQFVIKLPVLERKNSLSNQPEDSCSQIFREL